MASSSLPPAEAAPRARAPLVPLDLSAHLVVCVDTETTGKVLPCVVQLAAAVWQTNARAAEVSFTRDVNPGRPIEAGAIGVHGITEARVAGAPSFGVVWADFTAWVERLQAAASAEAGGQPRRVLLVAYNGFGFVSSMLLLRAQACACARCMAMGAAAGHCPC
jgi:hypothetical protein